MDSSRKISLFSIPKPFIGHNAIIQINALLSWKKALVDREIFLCGNDKGVDEVATKYSVKHIPHIDKNQFGTPLLSSAFDKVQSTAKG